MLLFVLKFLCLPFFSKKVSGCRASARRAAEGRTRLCRDQSNAMLALSPKESTEAVAACNIRVCVSSAETGGKFRHTGRFVLFRGGARLYRLSAVLGMKSPERSAYLRQKKNNATMQTALICHLDLTMQREHSCNVAIFILG